MVINVDPLSIYKMAFAFIHPQYDILSHIEQHIKNHEKLETRMQ